jgi:hypothetical protein
MKTRKVRTIRYWLLASVLLLVMSACSSGDVNPPADTAVVEMPSATETQAAAPAPTQALADTSAESPTAAPPATIEPGVLYQDDFTNAASGWKSLDFDSYYIGYHEPEYYHVEVHVPNDYELVPVPDLEGQTDFTIEARVFVDPNNTDPQGDFRYGLVFRRSGKQYYAFTVSPRSQQWALLKSSPSGLEELQSGSDSSLQGIETENLLRVDAQGSSFFFHINDRAVAHLEDSTYPSGEIGLFVQTFDSPKVHVHYDALTIRDVQLPQEQDMHEVLYQDDFTKPDSGWESLDFDTYFIGYHEPEYYHLEVHEPNDYELVPAPTGQDYSDFTTEVTAFVEPNNTDPQGDFRYGLIFRRAGKQYYAFTISPRSQQWSVLKSSPTGLETLDEGTSTAIRDENTEGTLRIDARGASFFFRINDQLVSQVNDSAYDSGEIGFFLQTFDSTKVHIHYDTLVIRAVDAPEYTCRVVAKALNVRNGPGVDFSPLDFVANSQDFVPLGVSPDGLWLRVQLESGEEGWVAYAAEYESCNVAAVDLPVIEP